MRRTDFESIDALVLIEPYQYCLWAYSEPGIPNLTDIYRGSMTCRGSQRLMMAGRYIATVKSVLLEKKQVMLFQNVCESKSKLLCSKWFIIHCILLIINSLSIRKPSIGLLTPVMIRPSQRSDIITDNIIVDMKSNESLNVNVKSTLVWQAERLEGLRSRTFLLCYFDGASTAGA
jgi:hypothetical protein